MRCALDLGRLTRRDCDVTAFKDKVIPPRALRPKRSDVRERLVSTAIHAFERDGFGGASLSTIAAEAGFSRGAVYSNFASKEELFLAALEMNAEARINRLFDRDIGLFQRGAAGIDSELIRAALGVTHAWSLLFVEFCVQAQREPSLQERLAAVRRRMRAFVVGKLRQTARADVSDAELDDLATLLMAMNNGLMIEELSDPQLDGARLLDRVARYLSTEMKTIS